ncbi:MAG: glycosyltransferase family 4 protein [Patescibacteria group bacterium]|mgnify:CR=1 FL=1
MHIGIYDPYLDDLGGGEKYMMTIAECLSHQHDVDIFWDNASDLIAVATRFSLDVSTIKIVPNVFAQTIPLWKRLLVTRKYDVIIFLSDGSIPLVLSKKLLVHIQQPLQSADQSSIKRKRITKIFYNSLFTRKYNQKLFTHIPSMVLYPPVVIKSVPVSKENIILHVGRFRVNSEWEGDYKKQFVMVESFKKMIDTGVTGWKFVLAVSLRAEDAEQFARLRHNAKGYPIEFLIDVPNDALWKTYNKAKIYWHASGYGEDLSAHPDYAEHFGISTVEAMGAGVVPIVINAGGQTEIVENGKDGLLWNTLEELVSKTKKLMHDQKLWQQLSLNAREKAQKFTKEQFCRDVQKLVSES